MQLAADLDPMTSRPFAHAITTTRSPPSSSSEFALVFSGDERFARGLAVAIYSTLDHLSAAAAPEICVLDSGLSASTRERLEKIVDAKRPNNKVRWIPIATARLPNRTSAPRVAVYSRLLIPELLPRHIRRAVYLDADVLVRRDLSPLFTIGLGEAPLAAVTDFAIGNTGHEWSGLRDHARPRPYFNTGVLVMELAAWRSTRLGDHALHYAAACEEPLPFRDQDALNEVSEKWQELDHRWNVQLMNLFVIERLPATELTHSLYRQRRHLYRTAAVWHFVGPKPWSAKCTAPGTMAWVRALIRSGWYTPSEALAWLLPWLCIRTPRHWLWLCKWAGARVVGSKVVGAARRPVTPQ